MLWFWWQIKGIEMKLYLVKSHEPFDYDTYDEMVASAESEDDARCLHPRTMEKESYDAWVAGGAGKYDYNNMCWIPYSRRSELEVKLIGESCVPRGVITASFNSG
jgi:hypothetical protein